MATVYPVLDNQYHQVVQLINMEDAPIGETSEYKKEREAHAAKVKKLYKDLPDNEVIKEMYEDVMQEEDREKNPGNDPFQYIHEAVWAAERAYRDGTSYSKVCSDLMDAISACEKIVSDKPSKKQAKGDDY